MEPSPRTPRRKHSRQRRVVTPSIPPDLLREATAFAMARGTPLRRRLCPARDDDTTVLALTMSDDGDYYLSTEDVESLPVPRRLHLAWVRERLGDADADELLDTLDPALGDAYVEELRDRATGDEGMALDERTYAQVFGGPVSRSDAELAAWLAEEIDFEEAATAE